MSMRILIAEDDPYSLQILQLMLAKEKTWQVVSAKDGLEAWNLLEQSAPFDVCIFDIMMPGLDGLQLSAKMRADPRFADARIIFCTALNDRATVQQAAALGVSHYITKPYQRESIFKQLRRIAAERATVCRIEPLANMVERLGIDEDLLRTMLTSLQGEIDGFLATLRNVTAPPATAEFSLKANALKGAAANLGAVSMAGSLAALESATAAEWRSVFLEPDAVATVSA
jgi:CheY-like chemotaxis protein